MPPDSNALPFDKYSGAGNDFVIVDADDVPTEDLERAACLICPRETGVGVDGLVSVASLGPDHVAARFFNPDGSEFGTCGNGTRCVARFCVERGIAEGPRLAVETADGTVQAIVDGDSVALDYEIAAWVDRELVVESEAGHERGLLVQIGTPHLVLPVAALPPGDIDALAKPIRHHPTLEPDGTNVNFVELRGRGEASIRTFERGIEGETLACGSGAMATVIALHEMGLADATLRLHTRSGAVLEVELLAAADRDMDDASAGERKQGPAQPDRPLRSIRLKGPARRLFSGVFFLPARA